MKKTAESYFLQLLDRPLGIVLGTAFIMALAIGLTEGLFLIFDLLELHP